MSVLEKERFRILVADCHGLYREALCMLLSKLMPEAAVLGISGKKDAAVLDTPLITLALLRLAPPYMEGFDLLRALHDRLPVTPIVLLSDVVDGKLTALARACGAYGFLHASAMPEDLLFAIYDVLAGRMVFPDQDGGLIRRENFQLSRRQIEVLDLLCKGMTNKEIGSRLRMSDNTVRTHVAAIFDILGVRNRTEAAMLGSHLF